jgi:hypothetical protein
MLRTPRRTTSRTLIAVVHGIKGVGSEDRALIFTHAANNGAHTAESCPWSQIAETELAAHTAIAEATSEWREHISNQAL